MTAFKFITGEGLTGRVMEARPVDYQGVPALELDLHGNTIVVPRDWAGPATTKRKKGQKS